MTQQDLGRLTRVDLRAVWNSESSDFTPWLARVDNLKLLGEALDIDLELEAQEKSVGTFRADILCKDTGSDAWVLIENQLEPTNHKHLGQLLTYASGLQAVTIVWIAESFREEHRATLDWLNKITDDSFSFFGLEVELWQIGESFAAPKFNIVSKPNDWSRSVAQAARTIDDTELSEKRIEQLEYWAALNKQVTELSGPVSGGNRKPRPSAWMRYSIGRSEFHLTAAMQRQYERVRAELYIKGDHATVFFNLLKSEKEKIENELGCALVWEELPARKACRVALYLDNADPENKPDWPRQHKWLADRLNELHRVFAPRIKALDPDDWQPEEIET